jgi:acyl transferase domain-containing protein/thioesterase domain-containing protein/acyl carrier protein
MDATAIAIVGMAGRFPGARNIREFWTNLRDGVESIRELSDEQLLAAGVTREELADANYVRRASTLDDVAMFDAAFFGFSPADAAIMDPQHRQFLECAWEALEDAAHPPKRFPGLIGVFAGSGLNTYLIQNLLANRKMLQDVGLFRLKQTGNDKDVLTTRVSYQLDLRGPSINVQTACSTSLVAVHLACQSLLNNECDMALAGGVTIEIPHGRGYIYREGEILSRDGHCRAFDRDSSGTVFGSGVGLVVLRRLKDALQDGDHIRAVILGSAINNDGARKVGYLAPSIEGQAEVIADALDFAGVSADQIDYVETHGTGTPVGDPIELRALVKAFRASTSAAGYCGIGSLKSNVGHLDAAAGIAGLIKTVLSLQHAQMPATLHVRNLNPHLELKGSPFFVNTELRDWPRRGSARRAGVTSLGIGGTNSHAVIEEAPQTAASPSTKPHQLLTVSAKSSGAADRAMAELVAYVRENPDLTLSDVAFTCQLGREAFQHRRALVVENTPQAIDALERAAGANNISGIAARTAPPVVFMFPGQGFQHIGMGRELYGHEPEYRRALDACARHLKQSHGIDVIDAIHPAEDKKEFAGKLLNQMWLAQPALFSVEYALARWWISLGVKPAAMIGHSLGEYTAACIAGVFSMEEALDLVVFRGRRMHELPPGAMSAVPLPPDEIPLSGRLSLAVINDPNLCVVAGPAEEIAAFEQQMLERSITCRRLHISQASHSAMVEPMLADFEEQLRRVTYNRPQIPYLSNVSGRWIKPEEATDPAYWARHMRQTVRFSDCLAELLRAPERRFVELGPGNALTSLVLRQGGDDMRAVPTLPHPSETVSSLGYAMHAVGELWASGTEIDWTGLHLESTPRRVPLPTYPFEHRRYWIEPDRVNAEASLLAETKPPIAASSVRQLYRRYWKRLPAISPQKSETARYLIFRDPLGLADEVSAKLKAGGSEVVVVDAGIRFSRTGKKAWTMRPAVREDYDALLTAAFNSRKMPLRIVHLWAVETEDDKPALANTLDRCFYSPLYLAQALAERDLTDAGLTFVSNSLQSVADEALHNPARAVFLGPARVIPKELPGIACRAVDIDLQPASIAECADALLSEMASSGEPATVALRKSGRFTEILEPFDLASVPRAGRLRREGVYLITGGLGGIGLTISEYLAREFHARLVLVGRSSFPPAEDWASEANNPRHEDSTRQRFQKLLELKRLAGDLAVMAADVADPHEIQNVIAAVRKQFGRIDGVFHAAGVLDDGPLALKDSTSARKVLAPKIQGTMALDEALRDAQLDCFVLFSSISSLYAPAGQVDYAAANAFLDAFALSQNGRVTAIDWDAWRDVGMAARAASPHPLLDKCQMNSAQAVVFSSCFSLDRQWLLADHKLKDGKGLAPGVSFLEMAAGAFLRGSLQLPIEMKDVFFLAPLAVGPNDSKEVRIQLQREQGDDHEGHFRFAVFAMEEEWKEHATGTIRPCAAPLQRRIDRTAILLRGMRKEIAFDELHRTRQEVHLDFGPRWLSLKHLNLGDGEGLAELILDASAAADIRGFHLHPGLLDMATGCSLYANKGYGETQDFYLPFSYQSVQLYRDLPVHLFSHFRSRPGNLLHGELQTFDITLFDDEGRVLAEIEGFSMRRIDDPARLKNLSTFLQDPGSLSDERPLDVENPGGILPADGAKALAEILAVSSPPNVVVLSRNLEELHPASEPHPAQDSTSSPAAEPAPDENVERVLASWWCGLLGIDSVGLDDDFFSLGGHSLIGVRLLARIKKVYGVNLELATLFQARTVRQFAQLIYRQRRPAQMDVNGWPTLVPLQPVGTRTPLFIVHAIGADVLFYEQFGKALAPEQPLYAFRSALVTRDEQRETTIEELASIYVREMREFFPSGPYLISGASFGGIVAYEMAHQLWQQGIEPGLVLLFDAFVPGSGARVEFKDQLRTFVNNAYSEGFSYLIRKARMQRWYWAADLKRWLYARACGAYRLAGRKLPLSLRYFEIREAQMRSLDRYVCKPYAGKVVLVRAMDRGPEVLGIVEDPTLGWGRYVNGGLQIINVPTRHVKMLEQPYVSTFVKTLETILTATDDHVDRPLTSV